MQQALLKVILPLIIVYMPSKSVLSSYGRVFSLYIYPQYPNLNLTSSYAVKSKPSSPLHGR